MAGEGKPAPAEQKVAFRLFARLSDVIDPIPSVFQEQEPIPAREWHEQYACLASGRAVSFRPTAPLQPRIQMKKPGSDRINGMNRILWVFPQERPKPLPFFPLPPGGEGRGEGESLS